VDQAAVNTIIRFLGSCLKDEGLTNTSIAVFGSALTNTMGPDSDLDLIIISSEFTGKSIEARGKMTMGSEIKTLRKFMIPMDVLNLTPDEYNSMVSRNMFPSKIVA
jgi:predicted nucleotidyltransferase